MAAPDYVPVSHADRPRRSLPVPPGRRWMADRPGDLQRGQPLGPRLGRPGPDQGYALSLATRFEHELRLAPGESEEDVIVGCVALALRRASILGRAPVIYDLELAFGLFGFLDDAPPELVEWRRTVLTGAGHQYWEQRAVADVVPESTLRMTPAQVRSRLADWRQLTGAASAGTGESAVRPPAASG